MSFKDPPALEHGSANPELRQRKKAPTTKLEGKTTCADGPTTPRSPPRWHISSITTSKPKGEDGVVVTSRLSNAGSIETTTITTVTVEGTSILQSDEAKSESPKHVAAPPVAQVVEDELAYIERKARDDGSKASTFPSLKDLLAALDELDQ